MHGNIGVAVEHRALNLHREDTLTAQGDEINVGFAVPSGVNEGRVRYQRRVLRVDAARTSPAREPAASGAWRGEAS